MPLLTEVAIRNARPGERPFKLKDERGLYLLVQPNGKKLWRLRFTLAGSESMLSLGAYPDVPLKLARERRDAHRQEIARGINPSAQRRAERDAREDTFKAIALEWLGKREHALAASTLGKTRFLLETLLFPDIGSLPIATIEPPQLLMALRKTEGRGRHELAHRAKQTAGRVFRYAIQTGRATRDPSADLRDALAPVKSQKRAAITDPTKIGALLRAIEGCGGHYSTEYALRLAPLVFVRPGELRHAKWEEFTLEGESPEWRIPAERMKMKELHVVPLSKQATSILLRLREVARTSDYLFPSLRTNTRPISENTLNAALRRMGYAKDEMTAHGFRAMASTLLNEQGFAPDVIELQLAHAERNKVRAAYNRATRLAERREMMQQWADYLDTLRAGKDNVVPLKRSA